ncbi:translocation/assembly module TamB domain-containing protein [Cognatiyoonia sp. IB215182]|uniref:translocation/assembly module TamB domain-containing protein n=1 Tax=Cognatiyoonia sp. IB215182 TaxID=3097353 RepID=UPI002A0EEB40|nr:translocation/assembly module TamB domain-containing protein [Cognatiyoonia sp. IB215182]MDX8354613.1 translocation/assembly module TamB domain-containing protein [Cognatiyoonia sp. IB215182]
MAQSQEEQDKSYLTSLIEDNLSGVSREVSIIGFQGALSSRATIDVLTVADTEGVWLTLEDIVLSWNRAALFRGAIDVQELSAERIVVARPPVSENTGPSPEAQPFSLPELPVSISLDVLNIDRIELGEGFLGEPIAVSLTGTAQLSGGEGAANVTALRLDDRQGRFEIDGAYVNATRNLDILLNLEEGPDGIAARIIGLPGQPAVGLSIEGNAPLDDFAATLAIATDGQDRLTGDFGLTETDAGRTIALDVGGDISPLFAPAYRGFFGTDAQLVARALQSNDGSVDIPELALDAGRVTLSGALQIGAQGWPALIDLTGAITPDGNAPVLLPLSGPRTFVDGMDLTIAYDNRVSDDWRANITIDGFDRPGLGIDQLRLQGGGILRPGEGARIGEVTANLQYGADGLRLDDAGAAEAFGSAITGDFVASRTEGGETEISRLTLQGAGLDATAVATIAGPDAGFRTNATLNARIAGLERFSTLVGQEIGGGAELGILANITPLEGLFSIVATGQTNDLRIGIPEADRVLAGTGDISASFVRDTEGTRLEVLNIRTDAATLDANAEITSDGITGQIDANVGELGQIVPMLTGPARIAGQVDTSETGEITFALTGDAAASEFTTSGIVSPTETGQTVNLDIDLNARDLSRFAALTGQPLQGAANLGINGVVLTDVLRFDLNLTGRTRNIVTGIDRLDPFLRGVTLFSTEVARPTANSLQLSNLSLRSPALQATGDAAVSRDGENSADLAFQINDAALLDPTLSGPIRLTLIASPAENEATQAALRLTGPETDVAFDGTIAHQDYRIAGDLTAQVANLGTYAPLIGQPVDGSIDLTASGETLPDLSSFDAQIRLQSTDLSVGNPTIDPLLAGTGRINAQLGQSDGILAVRTLEISTREVSIVGALNGAAGFGEGLFNASLRNVGVLTDQVSGPIRATGSASLDDAGNWGVDATATGPGGLSANVAGQYLADGNLDLNVDGSVLLALANRILDPRRLSGLANFDLQVVGPPTLDALRGQITFSDGRLAAPNLGEALENITGQIGLNAGTAQIDLQARVESGGGITINGPIAMAPPNNADVTLRLNNMILQNRQLYRSSIDGTVTLNGPLQGGARVVGRLELGETNVRVPSSAISTLGELPDVIHLGANNEVRQTLARADALVSADGNGEQGAQRRARRAYPLDIRIAAPGRIFIRGRGLDAELGGNLRIGGTSANVIPVGRFSLIRGRIDILQQRFELTEGTATLEGDFNPFLRLVATTETDSGTVINIIVEGPAGEPEVRFESVPELPQDEVLSQLIFGRDLSSISPLQAVQLASAISTLAGRGGGAFDRLRRNVGLDDLDITTDEEGQTAVRAGRYISDNVYTDVTVTSEGETEINLNLDLSRDITAKGSVDQDGETSLGIFFERDY